VFYSEFNNDTLNSCESWELELNIFVNCEPPVVSFCKYLSRTRLTYRMTEILFDVFAITNMDVPSSICLRELP